MNTYIEVVISLVLIFLLFSIVVYILQELLAAGNNSRGRMLRKALAQALDGIAFPGRAALKRTATDSPETPLTNEFFNHGQISALREDFVRLPSYIPAPNFAIALIDIISKKAPEISGDVWKDLNAGLLMMEKSSNPAPIVSVISSIAKVTTTIPQLQEDLQTWFNEYMARVSGWYKTHTRPSVRLLAAAVTIAFNINCFQIAQEASIDKSLRNSMNIAATAVVTNPDFLMKEPPEQQLYTIDSTLRSFNVRLGWSHEVVKEEFKGDTHLVVNRIVWLLMGWLLSAAALSMGAPFWFDVLSKLVNIRRAGAKPK